MSNPNFTLRELLPSDSLALTNLLTEFDGDMTTRFQVDPYSAIIYGTEYRTKGVVVEAAGYDGFVGMGTVRFGKVQFNGSVLPFAHLDGLKIRKEFRGNRLGFLIASWRIQQVRNEFRDDCVIGTGMLHDNHASHAVASKWCREFAESAFDVHLVPMLTRKPKPLTGVTVREIEPREYEEFTVRQNAFYEKKLVSTQRFHNRCTCAWRFRGREKALSLLCCSRSSGQFIGRGSNLGAGYPIIRHY